jgi:outer membrane cobalamin receptor
MHRHRADDVRRPIQSSSLVLSIVSFVLCLLISQPAEADSLRGRVIAPSGDPVTSAEVVVLRGQAVVSSARTAVDGGYGPLTIGPGTYHVVVVAPGLRLTPTTVTIEPGTPATLDLRLSMAAIQESVLVSAAQIDVPLSRTSSSTTVVTRADIDRLQMRGLTDALRGVPGFNMAPSGTIGSQTSLFPRGGESDYTLVLVDGVPQNAFGGAFDAAHLSIASADRIEVVRGPQSALYGSGAIGGIVHIISANGGRPRAAVSVEGGGYGMRAGTLTASTSSGAWSFGGGGDWLTSDGDSRMFDSVGGQVSNDDYRRLSGSASVAWSDSAFRRVRLDVRAGRNERGFPGAYGSDPDGLFGGLDTISRGENTHRSVALTATSRSRGRLDHRVQVSWAGADGSFISPFGESEDESARLTGRYQVDTSVAGTGVSVGAEGLRERALNTFITDETFSAIPVRRANAGVFAEARPEIADRVFATVGLRVERINRTPLTGDGSRPAFDSSVIWSANPKAAVAWLVRDGSAATRLLGDTKFRASAGTGIKAPTAFDIAFTDNPDLRPERSRSVDVGVEQFLLGSSVRLDATWFYNSYDDLIVAVSQPLSTASRYRTDNIANARSTGLEVSGSWRMTDALSTRVNWMWLDTSVLGVDSVPGAGFGVYAAGDALIRRPRHTAAIELLYSSRRVSVFALVDGRGAMRDLEPNWAASALTNPGRVHTTIGGSVRLAPGLEAYGRVTNAFDRAYEDVFGFPAMGRSAVAGLRVTAGR